jgi:hypothetical protein
MRIVEATRLMATPVGSAATAAISLVQLAMSSALSCNSPQRGMISARIPRVCPKRPAEAKTWSVD